MSTPTMLILIAVVIWWVHRMETREAEENWLVKQMIREARHTPGARRRQYGTAGYLPRERRRTSWAWTRM